MKKYVIVFLLSVFAVFFTEYPSYSEDVLKWSDCVEIAKKNHPDLISANEKIAQAKANLGVTRSDLLPAIDANAGLSKTVTKNNTTSDSTSYSVGVTGQQLLFDSGKTIYDTKNYSKLLEAAKYNYNVASATVRQNLRYAYVKLLIAQELITIDKEIVSIRKQNLDLVRMRYNSGLEHKGSLLMAEANQAQAELEMAQAERNLIAYQRNLVKNLGLSTTAVYRVEGDNKLNGPYKEKPDFEALADANPEVKEIIQQRLAAEYNLKSSKMDYSPKVYGTLSASTSGDSLPTKSSEYSAGVTMSLNLFQGGKSAYLVNLADAEYKQLFADEKSTRATILYTIESAWYTMLNSIDAIEVKKKSLQASVERTKIADALYSIGSIDFDNWTVIQDSLVNAKKTLLETESAALIAEADWIQAKGGTINYGE